MHHTYLGAVLRRLGFDPHWPNLWWHYILPQSRSPIDSIFILDIGFYVGVLPPRDPGGSVTYNMYTEHLAVPIPILVLEGAV